MKSLKEEIISWMLVFLGSIILASGFVFFINPYNIVPGGVYGASIVLHNLFPSIQVGTFGYMFDIPLLIISAIFLGTRLGVKTCAASMITPLIMNTMSWFAYPNQEALHSLDPSQLLGGVLDMSNQLILPVIIGSILIGIGSGVVVKAGATTGGTDIIGMLLHKYVHIRFSNALLIADGTVVLFGLVVLGLGFGQQNGENSAIFLSLYSLISIYIISRTVARTINGGKDDKLLFVISAKELVTLHNYIIKDLDRTATLIKSSGLYSGAAKEMIFLVVSYKEVQKIKSKIKEADPCAFVVVTDAYDTYGEGWKRLPNANELQPE